MALRITELVEPFIRVSDPKIAMLKGRILQGRTMGRTDVQVISNFPICLLVIFDYISEHWKF